MLPMLLRGEQKLTPPKRLSAAPTTGIENTVDLNPVQTGVLLQVPAVACAAPTSNDDEALRRKREEIRERLLRGEKIVVDKSGSMQVPSSENRDAIQVPPGKLAASFYWYENDRDLYQAEIEQMSRSFPQFTLQREDDGRLSWIGSITPGLL